MPYARNNSTQSTPLPLMPKVKEELKRMETLGVIERVTHPTDWCSTMVPVVNTKGNVTICVDMKKMDEQIKERYLLPTIEEVFKQVVKYSSPLSVSSGFYQSLCTVKAVCWQHSPHPLGKYYFQCLPFGNNIVPSPFRGKCFQKAHLMATLLISLRRL